MFVALSVLSSGGWLSGADGTLSIEVAVQGARIVRPDDLCVQTKVGSGAGHSHAQHAQADAEMMEAMRAAATAAEQHGGGATGPDGRPLPPPHARVFVTPSSPALGPVGGSAPVASPTMQPDVPPRSSSSSNSQRRSGHGHHQRGGSSGSGSGSGSGPFSVFSSFSSTVHSSDSPSPHYYPRSASPPSSTVSGASSSPAQPLTPMLEYLGQDFEHEDCDSYALAVQTRRFGGAGGSYQYGWGPASPGFDFGSVPAQLPHHGQQQSPPPVWHPDPSAHAHGLGHGHGHVHPAHSASHSHSPSHSHASLPPHLLTSTTRHGYVCIIRNSAVSGTDTCTRAGDSHADAEQSVFEPRSRSKRESRMKNIQTGMRGIEQERWQPQAKWPIGE